MVDITFYLVTQEIAQRSGVIESRYRIKDGRFVLDNKDLSYIRFTPDEYIDGLKGVEKVSKNEAMLLIEENGYKMGVEKTVVAQGQPQVESTDTIEEENVADETEKENNDSPAEETTDSGESQDNENQENENNEQEKEEE